MEVVAEQKNEDFNKRISTTARVQVILLHMKDPKKLYFHFRENTLMAKLSKSLMKRYGLESKQQLYEMFLLGTALDVPFEKVASIIKMRKRARDSLSEEMVEEILGVFSEEG